MLYQTIFLLEKTVANITFEWTVIQMGCLFKVKITNEAFYDKRQDQNIRRSNFDLAYAPSN